MKFWLWLGYIFSFGLLYVYLLKKAKKIAQLPNTKLTESRVIPFNVSEFVKACGGKQNLVTVKTTVSQLVIEVKAVEQVQIDKLQKLGIRGINKSNKQFRFVLGNFVNALKQEIENEQ